MLNLIQMFIRIFSRYEQRQLRKAERAMQDRIRRELDKPASVSDAAGLELDLTETQTGRPVIVRRDCAFCGRERSPADDNHADDCPYWTIGPGRDDL